MIFDFKYNFSDLEKLLDNLTEYSNEATLTKKSSDIKERSNDIKYNMISYDEYFEIQLIAPGYSKKDFTIEVEDDMLNIEVASMAEPDKSATYNVKQYDVGVAFEKSFKLNINELAVDSATSTYKNGILSIMFSKTKVVKKHTVNIK